MLQNLLPLKEVMKMIDYKKEFEINDDEIEKVYEILFNKERNFEEEKQKIIKSFESCCIEAVPGSGKTTTLVAKLMILAEKLNKGNYEKGICILTHTNIGIDIIKEKSTLDKELMLMGEMIDFYKYDDGFELAGLSDIQRFMRNVEVIGSYLSSEDLANLKRNLTIFRVSKSRAKNVRDKYKNIWQLFANIEEVKDIEQFIDDAVREDGTLKDDASLGLRDVRRQKQNINANIKEKFDDLMNGKDTQKAVSERIITQRNDRFVIAVKTDFKGLIKGIEHDRSATGSTVYIEPLNVVSLNNKLREYEAREREEIRKILLRLTELIRGRKEEILEIKEILEKLDFIDAKTNYGISKKAIIPKIINKEYLKLVEARHPLIDENVVVPINFELGNPESIMLITGPNTGGKTVTLKVAGLLTIMALSGIPIPAGEKTEIGHFQNVLAETSRVWSKICLHFRGMLAKLRILWSMQTVNRLC